VGIVLRSMSLFREVIVLSPKKTSFYRHLFMEIGIFFSAELFNAVVTSHSITLVLSVLRALSLSIQSSAHKRLHMLVSVCEYHRLSYQALG